jgi:hypothetical protein
MKAGKMIDKWMVEHRGTSMEGVNYIEALLDLGFSVEKKRLLKCECETDGQVYCRCFQDGTFIGKPDGDELCPQRIGEKEKGEGMKYKYHYSARKRMHEALQGLYERQCISSEMLHEFSQKVNTTSKIGKGEEILKPWTAETIPKDRPLYVCMKTKHDTKKWDEGISNLIVSITAAGVHMMTCNGVAYSVSYNTLAEQWMLVDGTLCGT